jgi:hypothetical protein
MPAIDFPASPSVNDEYSFEGRTWLWNGTGWEVKSYPAALQLGSASAPSLYFTGDPNTGLYSPGADQVAITTGGTGRLFVDASGTVSVVNGTLKLSDGYPIIWGSSAASIYGGSGTSDVVFTVGSSERMRINGATGFLGLGTSSPQASLHLSQAVGTSTTANLLRVQNMSAANASNIAQIDFWCSNTFTGEESVAAIQALNPNASANNGGALAFLTSSNGTSTTPAERLRITSDGKVGIGTSSPSQLLTIYKGSTAAGIATLQRFSIPFSGGADNGAEIAIGREGNPSNVGASIQLAASNYSNDSRTFISFATTNSGGGDTTNYTATEKVRIDSDGKVGIGTSSPGYLLDVAGDARITGTNGLRLEAGTTGTALYNNAGGTVFDSFTSGTSLRFLVASSEAARITSDGKVGIGTSSPAKTLDVTGTFGSTGNAVINGITVGRAPSGGNTTLVGTGLGSNTGNDNQAFGISVLTANVGGTQNVAVGYTTLVTNVSGSYNTAVGVTALRFGTGSNNSGFGWNAGAGNTGSTCTFIGFNAGADCTTGNNNTIIGSIAGSAGLSDTVIIGAGTTERLRIDSSGRLLVGTSTSVTGFQVQVEGTTESNSALSVRRNNAGNFGPAFGFYKSRGTATGSFTAVLSGDSLGQLYFCGADGTQDVIAARITGEVDGTPGANDMPGRLVFSTTADGAASPTERMRITSAGYVGIGTTTVRAKLDLGPDLSAQKLSVYADATYRIGFGVQGNEFRQYAHTGASTTWGYVSTSDQTTFTELMRLDSSGNLLVGKNSATANGGVLQVSNGITFPATQSACSDANTLDDYEEGTFTPTIAGTSTAGTGTYVTNGQVGRYTKAGNRVAYTIYLNWTAHTGTGDLIVNGLPFTANSTTNSFTPASVWNSTITLSANNIMAAAINPNTTNVLLRQNAAGGGTTAAIAMDTDGVLVLSGTYEV